ncbi:MAG TPA: acyltransferase [Clostridia bacterium]|nr:acyltransferase [Clostridia bacterium]
MKGLNGLRAIAAISVLIGHVTSFTHFDFNLPRVSIGFDGVTLFFTISGFLITYLLLQERSQMHTVNIKKFYFRRILRIWPIYYLVILISLLLAFFDKNISDIYSCTLAYYIFFAANIPMILHTGISIIVHYWSIGVEEQFYLFWPWVVKLVRTKLIPVTIAIIFGLFFLKSASWYFLGNHSILYRSLAVTRFHCMLIGAVGAMLYKNQNKYFISALTSKWVQIIAWLLTGLLFLNFIALPAPVTAEITALVSLVLIIGQVENTTYKVANLENKLFDFLGKISYGIYIIHPLVILLFSYLYRNLNLSFILQTIVVYSSVIATTVLVAYLSYEFYEKPFLTLKKRYMIVKSASSMLIKGL